MCRWMGMAVLPLNLIYKSNQNFDCLSWGPSFFLKVVTILGGRNNEIIPRQVKTHAKKGKNVKRDGYKISLLISCDSKIAFKKTLIGNFQKSFWSKWVVTWSDQSDKENA